MKVRKDYDYTKGLIKVLEIVGGQNELARKIDIKQPTIWKWLHITKRVPAEHVITLERLVNGQVTRYIIRPDIYPIE